MKIPLSVNPLNPWDRSDTFRNWETGGTERLLFLSPHTSFFASPCSFLCKQTPIVSLTQPPKSCRTFQVEWGQGGAVPRSTFWIIHFSLLQMSLALPIKAQGSALKSSQTQSGHKSTSYNQRFNSLILKSKKQASDLLLVKLSKWDHSYLTKSSGKLVDCKLCDFGSSSMLN